MHVPGWSDADQALEGRELAGLFGVALREIIGIRIGIGVAIAVEIDWE